MGHVIQDSPVAGGESDRTKRRPTRAIIARCASGPFLRAAERPCWRCSLSPVSRWARRRSLRRPRSCRSTWCGRPTSEAARPTRPPTPRTRRTCPFATVLSRRSPSRTAAFCGAWASPSTGRRPPPTTWSSSRTTGASPPLAASDGRVAWRFTADAPVSAPPVWRNGWLVAGIESGDVVALRAADGEELWRRRLGAVLRTRPSIAGQRLYLPLEDGRITVLELASGDPVWTRSIGGRPREVLALDALFVGSTDNFLLPPGVRRRGHRVALAHGGRHRRRAAHRCRARLLRRGRQRRPRARPPQRRAAVA